ncbi:MAG TPA: efflux RND transporter permease subunit [Planctomycetaceae bacterium]|jgi:multidrug efflux pump subunit AcrB|nr:efflux RND transporter permease subunit [Planctomycetaceae bacterium]
MNLSSLFIRRPVGTSLLTAAITMAGMLAYNFLPVSSLPQVDFPTLSVSASLPGASPETMASAVATPLERQFGRIAGITEMSSASYLGSTSITIQFDLNRNIDAAARDVQAAINAAAGQLPTNLPSKPTWRKSNPADAPILIPAITSDIHAQPKIYDAANSILAQKLSQIEGIGQVFVSGGSPPAVRIEINPTLLNNFGLGLDDVRTMLGTANANRPKGQITAHDRTWFLSTDDQLLKAEQYRPLIIAYRNGAPVRISDVGTVSDSVEDVRASGFFSPGPGILKPSVLMIIFRQPGANIIDAVDRVRAAMPQLETDMPAGMKINVVVDRTTTIRASVHDVELTLALSVGLVILVVFVFLRDVRATFIPSVAVPVSLIGTFGVMYLCGYSVDNLSLMALTISTGFVVDDAIVVLENINRYLEAGMQPMQAALKGAAEIGFTVLSISVSLVAVFIPILMMGGIIGRLFREFAVTISVAIAVSMVISLTTTPMMCAWLLKAKTDHKHGKLYQLSESAFDWVLGRYEASLQWVLRHQFTMIIATLATIAFTGLLFVIVPKGFFPQQDTSRLNGQIKADQDTSFQQMNRLMTVFSTEVSQDPDVENLISFTGGGGGGGGRTVNQGQMFVALKPVEERTLGPAAENPFKGGRPGMAEIFAWLRDKISFKRHSSADEIIARLRRKLAPIPGATLYLQSVQDLRIGGRSSSSQYQYTLQDDDLAELNEWAPKVVAKLRTIRGLVDVDSDQQNSGLQTTITVDREAAARYGISMQTIDNALYDAFGQRQVSTTYTELNQYHIVMTVPLRFWEGPGALDYIYVRGTNGVRVPLAAFAKIVSATGPLAVNHSGQFPSVTVSFNLPPGGALGDAVEMIADAMHELGTPGTLHGRFQGTAQAFQESLSNEPVLIAAALAAVYIVLGILYESYVHPITILSTLPSAGVGALLALLVTGNELNVMGLIGILLLIGIVKKNAIMMIDFAIAAERHEDTSPVEAIYTACVLRFRPIIMTTLAALFGGLPIALGTGAGSELRRPLGIAIVGGLIVSQALTLYTTPVMYLYLDRFRLWISGKSPAQENAHVFAPSRGGHISSDRG